METKLLEQNEIISKSYEVERNKTGVYFLIHENKIVYVGKTIKGLTRAYSHLDDKIFDRMYFIPCSIEDLDEKESDYIIKYSPIYNQMLNDSCVYLTLSKVKLLLKNAGIKITDKRIIQRFVNNNNLKQHLFCGKVYLHKNDYQKIKEYMRGLK